MAGTGTVSPLAPARPAVLPALAGVRLAAAESGSRYRGRPDLMLALFDEGTAVAGVLTRSTMASAPVDWCRARLPGGRARALLVNAGNANAFTGRAGAAAAATCAREVARRAGCGDDEVFLASTGVIGVELDPAPLVGQLDGLVAAAAADGWAGAARAIMTTDTFPKLATAEARLDGATVTVNGIAKGSGMIAPDMATMLAFIVTDAAVAPGLLQEMLSASVDRSFNAITVDGDTSTSDTVLAFATGRGAQVTAGSNRLQPLADALDRVCLDLAHQIVRDGEGAQKFIAVTVTGAADDRAARRIAMAIANSPLVKTAIAGGDANWGRIVMAVGKSGEAAERDRLRIWIGGIGVARHGAVDPDYREADLVPHMAGRDIDIRVDVGVGAGEATVWTCDLTHGYIDINADYRS